MVIQINGLDPHLWKVLVSCRRRTLLPRILSLSLENHRYWTRSATFPTPCLTGWDRRANIQISSRIELRVTWWCKTIHTSMLCRLLLISMKNLKPYSLCESPILSPPVAEYWKYRNPGQDAWVGTPENIMTSESTTRPGLIYLSGYTAVVIEGISSSDRVQYSGAPTE